eukprot:COSAG01_NODE_6636_length_3568_cov_5.432113_6_plen_68_part_00
MGRVEDGIARLTRGAMPTMLGHSGGGQVTAPTIHVVQPRCQQQHPHSQQQRPAPLTCTSLSAGGAAL